MFSFIFKLEGKDVRRRAVQRGNGVMVAAAAAHEIRSGATAIESHSPNSPQGFPWRQEVTALEADDFLWDSRASGLC